MAKRGGFPGGGMPGNMANLMKQAQKMQRQMEEQAKEMETKEFTAAAGCLSLPAGWAARCRDCSDIGSSRRICPLCSDRRCLRGDMDGLLQ